MTKQEFIAIMDKSAWTRDRYGHYKVEWKGLSYRLKVQELSVRYEKRQSDGSWFNKASNYYKNLEFLAGRINIGGRSIPIMELPA